MKPTLSIVADNKVPFLEHVFDGVADVVFMEGADIRKEDMIEADALIIRTRTKCNADLLDGTTVKMIATATIGTDHIDLQYCKEQGIKVCNAAGCNAGGVMQYVMSALFELSARGKLDLKGKTLGIIGVGNVGSRVAQAASCLGIKTLLCDPPRAASEGNDIFVTQDELLEHSDIVTMHVPLDTQTIGMCDEAFFAKMKPGAVFVNAARGEILRDEALLGARSKLSAVVIDTWNNESTGINGTLLDTVDIATPHIAGYSYQGKLNGTSMAVRSVARHFGLESLMDFYPEVDPEKELYVLDVNGMSFQQIMQQSLSVYNPAEDDSRLRSNPEDFEYLRGNYNYRKEIKYTI